MLGSLQFSVAWEHWVFHLTPTQFSKIHVQTHIQWSASPTQEIASHGCSSSTVVARHTLGSCNGSRPLHPRILSWTRENPRVHWSHPICWFCCHGHKSKCSVSLFHNCPRIHKALHVPICKCRAPRTTFQVDTPFVKSSVDDLNVRRIPPEPCARKCWIAHASGSNTFRFAKPDVLEAVMSRVSPLLDHMVQGDESRPLLSSPSLVDCRD